MNEALWLLGRGLGVATLVMLTLSVVAGVVNARRATPWQTPRFAVAEIHRRASLTAAGLLVAHLVTLLADPQAQLSAVDAVVPFLNARNPFWWGLGTLTLDILAAVVVTSLLRKRIGYRTWRAVHLLAYASWPIALAHSLGGGTDAGSSWFRVIAIACTSLVVAAVLSRVAGGASSSTGSGRPSRSGRPGELVPVPVRTGARR